MTRARSGGFGGFVSTVLLLALGGGLLYGNLVRVEWGQQIAELLKVPLIGASVGGLIIFSVLLRGFSGGRKRKPEFVELESDSGTLGISTRAVTDFIVRVGGEFDEIRHISATLSKQKEVLNIQVFLKVQADTRIPELTEALRARVRESLRELLGIDGVGNIEVRVREIVGNPSTPSHAFKRKEPRSQPSKDNPVSSED